MELGNFDRDFLLRKKDTWNQSGKSYTPEIVIEICKFDEENLDGKENGAGILLGWQLSNCGFFLQNQRQFFHGTK